MGIDINKLQLLEKLLTHRLDQRVLSGILPASSFAPKIIEPQFTEQTIIQDEIGELTTNQKEQTTVMAPSVDAQSIILDPLSINPELEKTVLAEINKSESVEEKPVLDDKVTEKPQLTLGQVVNHVLPLVLPAPVGMIFNFLAQAGDDKKDTKYKKPETEGAGAEAGSETGTNEKSKPSLWDTLSSGFAKLFKPITEPLTGIWNGIKKQIGIEKFTDLLNNKFDLKQSSQESKKFQELASNKQITDKVRLEKEIIAKEIEKQNILDRLESERQFRLAQEAKANEARLAQESEIKKSTLAAVAEQQHKEAALTELAPTDTKKSAVDETKEALRRKLISINNRFNFSINPNLVGSNTSFADLDRIIKKAMIENPSAGLAYLYSMGKDLYSLSNNSMFRSNDSANMTTVLANYINSGSDPTVAPKTIDEYLSQQQGRSSLYNA